MKLLMAVKASMVSGRNENAVFRQIDMLEQNVY